MADHRSEPDNFPIDGQRLVDLVVRRRWWIFAACWLSLLLTIGGSYLISNRYSSEATVLVVQQQIPERYVVPTSTTDITQSLQAMTQDVLSRTRLMRIVEELNLYPDARRKLPPEHLIELMRSDISIAPTESTPERHEANTFKISFVAEKPHVAQEVASRLTALFIEQNLKTRSDQSATTTRFLREQLDFTKKHLMEQEQNVRDFKMQFLGELPEQQQGNIGILAGLQGQLDNVMGNINRTKQQRLYLESLISAYRRTNERRARLTKPGIPGAGASADASEDPVDGARRDLAKLQADLRALLVRYTEKYPDVVGKQQEIKAQQRIVEALEASKRTAKQVREERAAAAAAAGVPAAPVVDPESTESIESETAITELRSQLETNRMEMEYLTKMEAKLRADTEAYQSRLNLTPVREQQLTSLLRDYELIKKSYADLTNKELEAQLAATLEKRQEGQQFRMIDPPNLPTVPDSPKRLKISLGGAAVGLLFGVVIALFLDLRNGSVYSEKEVIKQLGLPAIGIPVVMTPFETRARSWKRGVEVLSASVMLLVIAIAEYYVVRHG